MAEVDKNDPPDELQDNFGLTENVGGGGGQNILESSDNNHFQIMEGQQQEQEAGEPYANETQVNVAGEEEHQLPYHDQEPMDTAGGTDQNNQEIYPGERSQEEQDNNEVDDIERTLQILDHRESDHNEAVDEIEHTLEMLEADDPTGYETNQIDTGNDNPNEIQADQNTDQNANEDVQMSFEEEQNANESLNDRPDENNPIQDTIEIDDDDNDYVQESNSGNNGDQGDDQDEEHTEDHEENNEDQDEQEAQEDESAATNQETEENEDQEDNSTSQVQEDLEDNQDSGENIQDANNANTEPMEVHDEDNENDVSAENASEEKKTDESLEHNDAEGHTEDVEHVQEPEESDVCLIPDDEENEVTDAEREKARQVREDADKEDEQQLEKEKIAEEEANTSANANSTVDTHEPEESMQQDVTLPTDEPSCNTEETESERIIISTAVTTEQICVQCQLTKNCSYRFKHAESGEYKYVCELVCAQILQNSFSHKYFIRNKKFLLEEADPNDGVHICVQCKESKKNKYFFKVDDEFYYICNNDCYNLLNMEEPDKYKIKRNSIRVRNIGATINHGPSKVAEPTAGTDSSRIVARTEIEADVARIERNESFVRRCVECDQKINLNTKVNLNWETYDFCNEMCLGKYQREIGANCKTCDGDVPHQSMGKYCVRFGFEIRQFCKASCLNEYKKGLKTCSCCQKDISQDGEGFLAPVGDKDQFKDFCSQSCMRKYDYMCNPKKKFRVDKCAVCNIEKPIKVEMILDNKEHHFCTNPCFSAFKFVSNINADQCNMCSKYFERKNSEKYTIYTDNKRPKVFCCKICINVYIIVNRKIVSCQWCKVKKYNFDMIYRQFNNQEILMCSLNCLTLHTVSASAVNRSVAKCDNCNANATPQYHLTMSDSSMRNFCKYQCVMKFQNQFGRTPLTLDNNEHKQQLAQESMHSTKHGGGSQKPFPTGLPKKVKPKPASKPVVKPTVKTVAKPTAKPLVKAKLPVISKVASLASFDDAMDQPLITRNKSSKIIYTDDSMDQPLITRNKSSKIIFNDDSMDQPLITRNKSSKMNKSTPKKAISSPVSSAGPKKAVSAPLSSVVSTPPATRYSKTRNSSVVSPSPPPPPLPTPSTSKKKGAATSTSTSTETAPGKTKIVTIPPVPVIVRNVQTMCKPFMKSVGIDNTVETLDAQNQTEKDFSAKCLLPVPVPIYLPTPMHMYATPYPVPIPIPIPIPVPIFIPTTRNSAAGIMKEINKIQDKMPADPFEAELLMMAEMVADDKRQEESESDTEDTKPVLPSYSSTVNNSMDTNNFGDDVLQMALKMATSDYDDHHHPHSSVDLESPMHPSTINNPPPNMIAHNEVASDQMIMLENNRGAQRGKKRPPINTPISPQIRTPIRAPAKRMRREPMSPNEPESHQQQQQQQQQQQPPPQVLQQPLEKPDANMCLKYTFGVNAWKQWVVTKNADMEKSSVRRRPFKTELLQMTADELNYSLCLFVKEVRKPNGTEYAPDTIYYLVLGIQQYLYENGRIDNIFTDPYYERFTDCLDEVSKKFSILYNDSQYIVTRVEEEHLWECKQLGAHSPHVLLSTLMFFNTKHFNLTSVEEHMQLSFSHIMKHWKRTPQNVKSPGARNVLLRFYPPQTGLDSNPRKKKVYEQQENEENPLRCPVRLYEFYLSKCPESVKTRNDVFYLQPERSCVPDSPVWYSTQALSQESLQKMLHRVKMVKEINIALLTS